MVWRVVDNKGCPERCDACRRGNHECVARWQVIETDGYGEGDTNLVTSFASREEAEAYVSADEETRRRLDEEALDKW
jgi:hypothetical protein